MLQQPLLATFAFHAVPLYREPCIPVVWDGPVDTCCLSIIIDAEDSFSEVPQSTHDFSSLQSQPSSRSQKAFKSIEK